LVDGKFIIQIRERKKSMKNKKKDCPFRQIKFDPKSTIPFIILSGVLIEKQTKVDFLHPRIVPINRKKIYWTISANELLGLWNEE